MPFSFGSADYLRIYSPFMGAPCQDIDDELIERYIRFPQTLSAELRETIEQCLEQDERVREQAEFYRDFYEQFDRTDEPQKGPPEEDTSDADSPAPSSSQGSERYDS